jgi:hypothetical protein
MGIMSKIIGSHAGASTQYEYKELSQQFLDAFAVAVSEKGFKRRGRSFAFVRQRPSGSDVLHLPLSKYDDRFVVMPGINIRFDELEEFINRYAVNRDVKKVKNKSSTGMSLGELAGQKEPLRWSISNSKDVTRSLPEIEKYIRTYGFPYFEKIQSLGDLHEILCNKDEKGHVYGNAERAIYCVALAHLTSHSDSIPGIVQRWRNVFKDTNDASARFFEGFYQNYLQENS